MKPASIRELIAAHARFQIFIGPLLVVVEAKCEILMGLVQVEFGRVDTRVLNGVLGKSKDK